MTTPVPPVGPVTDTSVAGWLGIPETHSEYAHVQEVVPAVNSYIATYAAAKADPDSGEYPAHIVNGALRLAGRMVRNRNTPGGSEVFADLTTETVARIDPDMNRLLGLGAYRDLIVG